MVDKIILGFLFASDMSGYDVKRFMSMSTANFLDASYGSIYPALKKLERNGLVSLKERVEGGKFKKVYSIEPSGREDFMEWLQQPIEASATAGNLFLARIFFYGFLPKEKALELLQNFVRDLEQEKSHLERAKSGIPKQANIFQLATLYMGIEYYEFAARFFEKFIKEVEQAPQVVPYECG